MRLVINADDLGLTPTIDDAIRVALELGTATSASVLANGPSSQTALAWAAESGRTFGVHLALTEVAALTPFDLAPDGPFRPDAYTRLCTGAFSASGLVREWVAQVEHVRAAGVRVDHLDSHQHIHHLPAVRPLLTRVARAVDVRRVRGMSSFGGRLQALRAWRYRAALRSDGLVTTDGFSSVDAFRRVPLWDTVELMCHPGNVAHARYAHEMKALPALIGARISWSEVP